MELYKEMRELSDTFEAQLKKQMDSRVLAMDPDDNSHYLIYRVLGIAEAEGKAIDVYQNKGRFLYKYAGSFLETAARMCFTHKYPECGVVKVANTLGARPKTFEIDAPTDGDHITKEHPRLKVIADMGFKPIRVMFYYPNRDQAIRIQKTLETLYKGVNGDYHFGDAAWTFIKDYTGVELKEILTRIAKEKTANGNS